MYISGQKRGIKTRRLKKCLKRRQAIEPVIGDLKSDGLLGRNYLNGTEGDRVNVMLSCAGHNLRFILRQLMIFSLGISWPLPALQVVSVRIERLGTRLNRCDQWITRITMPESGPISVPTTACKPGYSGSTN